MICQYFGGIIIHRDRPIHGHTTLLSHYGEGMFQGLPEKFNVMLYHSLQVDENSIPSELNITAKEKMMSLWDYSTINILYTDYSITQNPF